MEQIWAPWRLAFVQSKIKQEEPDVSQLNFLPGADQSCFICQAIADGERRKERYVVAVGAKTLVIMNKYPYNNGHLLVTPQRHVAQLSDLTSEEHLELMSEVTRMIELLKSTVHPDGFNVGLNLGAVAGAGLPGHLHWHIVPRWNGDTNFMPVFANVKVIPQSLEALWEALVENQKR